MTSQGAPEAGATELLPCPFCGGKADRMREWSGRLSTMICCVDATCIGHHYEQDEQGGWNHEQSLDENVAAWNRRAASPSPPPGVGEEAMPMPERAFITSIVGDGDPYVKIQFAELAEMQDFYRKLALKAIAVKHERARLRSAP